MKMPAGIEKWGSPILGVVSLLLAANLVHQFLRTRPRIAQPAPGYASTIRVRTTPGQSHVTDDLSQYDPMVNLDALKDLDARPLPDTKRSLFSFVEPPPPPAPLVSPVLTQAQVPPPPPPPPPPILIKIVGYNEAPGMAKQAFASYQDQVQVVQEGDVVGSRYKILRITPQEVLVEDATSHQTAELPVPQ